MRTIAFPHAVTDDPLSLEGPHFDVEAYECEQESGCYSAAEVAALSTDRVMAMPRRELIEVIRSVRGGHLRPGVLERLPQMDGETLRRLVCLTRRFCRNQARLTEDAASGIAIACV